MNIHQSTKNLFFKFRWGFKGVPFNIGVHTVHLDESLRRWDLNIEEPVHQVLAQHLKPNDIFIDIGANFGLHALYAAKLVGKNGHVFAFEPVESNLRLLHRNINLSEVTTQVTIVPKAVSASLEPFLEFFLPPEEVAVTASLRPNCDTLSKVKVPNVRLDDFWSEINQPIKVIKIDVEGAELEVLKGAQQVLTQWHPILVIEVHGFALPDFGTSLQEFREFLCSFGYDETHLEGEQFSGDDYYQAVYHKAR